MAYSRRAVKFGGRGVETYAGEYYSPETWKSYTSEIRGGRGALNAIARSFGFQPMLTSEWASLIMRNPNLKSKVYAASKGYPDGLVNALSSRDGWESVAHVALRGYQERR